MLQHEFIWMASNCKPQAIEQGQTGITTVTLRDDIQITHNYKKGNQMQVLFLNDGKTYTIQSKEQLEEIYRLHLGSSNLELELRRFCENELK